MSHKKIVGYALIAAPFAAMAGVAVYQIGWSVFVPLTILISTTACIFGGAHLIVYGDDK